MVKFRVLLDLTEINSGNAWIFISSQKIKRISDFKKLIQKKFNLSKNKFNLFLRGGFLLDDEEIEVLQKDDIIKLQYQEKRSRDELNFKNNSQQTEPKELSSENSTQTIYSNSSNGEPLSKRRRLNENNQIINEGYKVLQQPSTSIESQHSPFTLKNVPLPASSFSHARTHLYPEVINIDEQQISSSQPSTSLKDAMNKLLNRYGVQSQIVGSQPSFPLNYQTNCKERGDIEKKEIYNNLVELNCVEIVLNSETFECPVCFSDIAPGKGVILKDCLHSFCKECLKGAVQHSDAILIKCPFLNDEYSCESHLQEREIRSLVTPEVYNRYLQRSAALAESQASNSFHCKTPDCPGWCFFENNVNTFQCPVCMKSNCISCAAIHEGKNCKQYQDYATFFCTTDEEASKTKKTLQDMVKTGKGMHCPKCNVIIMKKSGCDGLICKMCNTDLCWATKGPRWGPKGKGDTSGGCKCMVNGKKCHNSCQGCH